MPPPPPIPNPPQLHFLLFTEFGQHLLHFSPSSVLVKTNQPEPSLFYCDLLRRGCQPCASWRLPGLLGGISPPRSRRARYTLSRRARPRLGQPPARPNCPSCRGSQRQQIYGWCCSALLVSYPNATNTTIRLLPVYYYSLYILPASFFAVFRSGIQIPVRSHLRIKSRSYVPFALYLSVLSRLADPSRNSP